MHGRVIVTSTLLLSLSTGPAFANKAASTRRVAAVESIDVAGATEPFPENWVQEDRKIEFRLLNVASNTQVERYVLGSVLVAATGYLWGVYIAQTKFTTGDVRYVAKGVVGTTGILFGVGGLATLLFPGDAESAGKRYRMLRPKTARQLQEKIAFGEAELRRLSHRASTSRNLVGGLFTAVGLADLIWFAGTGPNTNLNFLAYLGGLYTSFGVLFLVLKSPAEREYEDFQKSKVGNGGLPGSAVSLDVSPLPGGALAGLRWTF